MKAAQEIFLVLFAIFWGTSANAWPRWRAFHWTFMDSARVCRRILWSLAILNILPVIYLGGVLKRLGQIPDHSGVTWHDIRLGAIPAFAIFGIYRIWISGIELCPLAFYYKDDAEQQREKPGLRGIDPTIRFLGVNRSHRRWWVNAAVGLIYIAICILTVWHVR